MKYFSFILIFLFIVSCNGGGGDTSITNITNKEFDKEEDVSIAVPDTGAEIVSSETDYSGEYTFAYEPSDNSRIVIYLKIDKDTLINRTYTFPYKNDLSIANYTENIGKIKSLGENKFEVIYSKESCDDVGSEIFSIEGDPRTSILVSHGNITLRLANNDLLKNINLEQIGLLKEDVSCKEIPKVVSTTAQLSSSNYSALLNQVQCRTGQRLSDIYTFSSSSFSGSSQITIQGTFNSGGVGGATIAREYVGVGYYGDVMIVQKVTDGSQVIGYNVLLSMCTMTSSNGAPYVSDSRQLTNFSGKIVLDDEVSCGHGMVDSSQTSMQSQVDPNYSYLPVFQIDTWFTKVGCVLY